MRYVTTYLRQAHSGHVGRRRLIVLRFDGIAILVQRPEVVAEQMVGVVFLLQLRESIPVLPEGCLSAARAFVPAEELMCT